MLVYINVIDILYVNFSSYKLVKIFTRFRKFLIDHSELFIVYTILLIKTFLFFFIFLSICLPTYLPTYLFLYNFIGQDPQYNVE